MESVNKRLACEPFPSRDLNPVAIGGLVKLKAKSELQPLKVVWPASGSDYLAGDTVYVRADGVSTYGKDVYVVNEVSFILVPEDQVVLVERLPRPVQFNWPNPIFNACAGGGLLQQGDAMTLNGPMGHGG